LTVAELTERLRAMEELEAGNLRPEIRKVKEVKEAACTRYSYRSSL
jgi:hypothetical protein